MKAKTLVAFALMACGQAMAGGMNYGLGATPCSRFVAAIAEAQQGYPESLQLYNTWVSGYATHLSAVLDRDLFEGLNAGDVQFKLEQTCRQDQTQSFLSATIKVLQ